MTAAGAVESVFIGASNELGAFESGVTARAFGAPLAFAGEGIATVAIAAGFWALVPSLRNIDTSTMSKHLPPTR